MAERYCPAYGPGSDVCPRSICDCFIDEFPDDMKQAGALHPEFYRVVGQPQPFTEPTFPIFAIDFGTVRSIEDDTVLIEYRDGRFSRLFHVNDIEVVVGQSVVHGQRVGTGRGF